MAKSPNPLAGCWKLFFILFSIAMILNAIYFFGCGMVKYNPGNP